MDLSQPACATALILRRWYLSKAPDFDNSGETVRTSFLFAVSDFVSIHEAGDKRDQEENQEQVKQQLRKSRRRDHESGKTQDARDDRDNEKNHSPTQHRTSVGEQPDSSHEG
jgi:recombinational DNA repair ATPase RecF